MAKDDDEFDRDEVELAPEDVAVAEDELRMTKMDCDFSKRFNVCNTNGPLSSPVAVVIVPKRLLSVLKLREA